jgi:hypothetical protein
MRACMSGGVTRKVGDYLPTSIVDQFYQLIASRTNVLTQTPDGPLAI